MRERRTGRGALAVAVVLSLVAALGFGIAANTAWARRTILDTDGFLDHVSRPLLADPRVKDALATELTEQVLGDLDLTAGLTDYVPFVLRVAADRITAQVVGELEDRLRTAVRHQLDDDLVTRTWDRASREVQSQLVGELSSGRQVSTVAVDLHGVLVRAIHDVGVELQARYPSLPLVVEVFDGIAQVLPAGVGVVPIDVSRIDGPARLAIAHAAGIEIAAVLVGVVTAGLALVVSSRRGITIAVLGAGLVVAAGVGYATFAYGFADAGAKVAAQSTATVSTDVQQIIDIQAGLIVASYRPWALGLAVAGLVLVLAGAGWALLAPRAPTGGDPWSGGGPGPVVRLGSGAPAVGPSGWEMPEGPPLRPRSRLGATLGRVHPATA